MNFNNVYSLDLEINNHNLEVKYQKVSGSGCFDLIDAFLPDQIYGDDFRIKK